MALIIENGTAVANSDSYVTRVEYIAYALALGIAISNDFSADVQLVESAQFIESHGENLKGYRLNRDQSMAWPRGLVETDGWLWNSDEIPRNLKLAQMAIALDLNSGVDLYNPQPVRTRKKELIEGAIEVEYFGQDSAVKLSRSSRAKALLNSLLKRTSNISLVAVRS
tara:strand:+ start:655 stop:1158 length:504 start_codon:yes stop_codon:yes gene_type:complete